MTWGEFEIENEEIFFMNFHIWAISEGCHLESGYVHYLNVSQWSEHKFK